MTTKRKLDVREFDKLVYSYFIEFGKGCTINELSEYVGVSTSTLYRLANSKERRCERRHYNGGSEFRPSRKHLRDVIVELTNAETREGKRFREISERFGVPVEDIAEVAMYYGRQHGEVYVRTKGSADKITQALSGQKEHGIYDRKSLGVQRPINLEYGCEGIAVTF